MKIIVKGKTNWKYLVAVVATGFIFSGAIIWLMEVQKNQFYDLKTPVFSMQDQTAGSSSRILIAEEWNTYRNEEYGFEIKHPKEGEIETLIIDSIPIFSININGEREVIDISPLGKRLRGYEDPGISFQTSTAPFTGGIVIKTTVFLNGKQIHYWLDNFKGISNFSWSSDSEILVSDGENSEDRTLLIDQILSTFRFIK